MKRHLDLIFSMLLVIGAVTSAYFIGRSDGYDAGDHDARHWTHDVRTAEHAEDAMDRERHDRALREQCDERIDTLQHILRGLYRADGGTP